MRRATRKSLDLWKTSNTWRRFYCLKQMVVLREGRFRWRGPPLVGGSTKMCYKNTGHIWGYVCVYWRGANKMTFVVNQKKRETAVQFSYTKRFHDLWRILNPFIDFITIYTIIILNVTYTTSLTNVVPAHCTRGLPSSWNGGQWWWMVGQQPLSLPPPSCFNCTVDWQKV